jgi:hypothetical protein
MTGKRDAGRAHFNCSRRIGCLLKLELDGEIDLHAPTIVFAAVIIHEAEI